MTQPVYLYEVICTGSHDDYRDAFLWCCEELGDPFGGNENWFVSTLMYINGFGECEWGFSFTKKAVEYAALCRVRWG